MTEMSVAPVTSNRDRLVVGVDRDTGIKFVYDVNTTNLSFLQTASDLKRLGIKNNMFFLKLYDRSLLGVNPFAPNLSNELIDRIALECMMNPWYFLRECVRIPEQGGATGPGSGSPFLLHRGNLAAAYCFFNSVDFYLVIPRQCFKTHSTLAMLDWAYLFGTTNSVFNFSNKTQKDSDDNLRKFKDQKAVLPVFMQQKFSFQTSEYALDDGERKMFKGLDNVRCISNPITGNRIESKPSARTEESADGIGRGNSAPIQLYDEVEFTSYIGTIIKAAGPAYSRAAKNAETNGAIHCRIFITTPGNIDSGPVRDTIATRDNAAEFTEQIYDMDVNVFRNEFMKKRSKNGICYIEFNYKQIGMDEEWYQSLCRVLEGDKVKIKREVLLQRIRGTSQSPFDPDDLDTINNFRREPIEEILIQKVFTLYVYTKLEKSIPYIVGVDCATGTNGDSTSIMIIDPYTVRPCACLKTPLSDAVESSQIIVQIVKRYIPKCVLAIESNHLGSAIIAILKKTSVAPNLYFDPEKILIPTAEDKLDAKGFAIREAENRRYWGINTNLETRKIMMSILMRHARDHKGDFVCRELIDDLNNLIQKPNGKIEAASGEHDDVVMSYLIALYVYYHGTRLSRYGIIKGVKPNDGVKTKQTYEEIYASLPEELKAIFPPPHPTQVKIAPSTDLPATMNNIPANKTQQPVADNEITRRINQIQEQRRVTTTSGGIVVVRNNDYEENLDDGREDKFDDSIFDICDIINDN